MRILLVEDDEMIGEAVADGLKGEGYAVDWVKDLYRLQVGSQESACFFYFQERSSIL